MSIRALRVAIPALALTLALALSGSSAAGAMASLLWPRVEGSGDRATSAQDYVEAERLLKRLSLPQEAAQVLLVGVSGQAKPAASSLKLLASMPLGGVLLFGYNVPDEAAALGPFVAALQDASAGAKLGIPLVVALDHEGGSVFRFRGGGITRLPPPELVGERGAEYALALGKASGRELDALGVNMALAPVVELLTDANESFLGDRSYGRSPKLVDEASGAFIEGLQAGGVAAVAKHFPGNAAADPHKGSAILGADRAAYERDLLPRFAAASRRGVAVIMASHAILPAIDPAKPATLSKRLLDGELKRRLDFRGIVLTDDLYMRAVAKDEPPERSAVEALAAGADLLMLGSGDSASSVRDAIVRAVESGALPRSRLDDAARRVLGQKLRFRMADALDSKTRAAKLASFPAMVKEDARLLSSSLVKAGKR